MQVLNLGKVAKYSVECSESPSKMIHSERCDAEVTVRLAVALLAD